MLGGDMFNPSTIPPCDAILMKHILHDWNDESSTKILASCHAAINEGGKFFIADAVLPPPGAMTPTKPPQIYLDTLMMVIGGKERTRAQWEALAASAGFVVEGVTDTPSPACQIVTLVKA